MKKLLVYSLFTALLLSISGPAMAKKSKKKEAFQQDLPLYMIYNSEGEKITYAEMLDSVSIHEICLFGELHDDVIAHWMEKRLTTDIVAAKGQDVILGGEMWETDDQAIVDEFMNGWMDKKSYVQIANNWPNFRDYKPLMGVAIRNDLQFVCTNIPRRYASVIYKKGAEYLDSLPQEAYQYLPPMPIHFDLTQPVYANMLSLFAPSDDGKAAQMGHNPMANYKGDNLVKAQAIKDATMAYNIVKYWEEGKFFMHYNGVYHSKNKESICYYLEHYKPGLDVVTISVGRQDSVTELEEVNNTGDYNIIVRDDMPKSYE